MPRGPSIEREKRLGEIRAWVIAEPAGLDYWSLIGNISSRFGVGPRVSREYLEDLMRRKEIRFSYGRVYSHER